MSVSSERSCYSPTSSCGESSGCAPIKLKRRWIQMNSVDDLHSDQSAVDLSLGTKRTKFHKSLTVSKNYSNCNAQSRHTLPEDPRDWTKKDVLNWLKYMTTTYALDVSQDKFNMNGKALCLMNIDMFVKRVPIGGKLLYKDFRLRLYPVVFFQERSNLTPLEMLALTARKYFS